MCLRESLFSLFGFLLLASLAAKLTSSEMRSPDADHENEHACLSSDDSNEVIGVDGAESYLHDRLAGKWTANLPMAGRAVGGVVAEARIDSSQKEMDPEDTRVILSVRNLNNHAVLLRPAPMGYLIGSIIVHDSLDKAPPLRKEIAAALAVPQVGGDFGPRVIVIKPGCAFGVTIPLGKYYDLPFGKYKVIAYHNVNHQDVVSAPLSFEVRHGKEQDKIVTISSDPPERTNRPRSDKLQTFDKQWTKAAAIAGQSRNNLVVDASISPIDSLHDQLLVSVRNVGWSQINLKTTDQVLDRKTPDPKWRYESSELGILRANRFEILLRDSAGNAVPLTLAGKKFLDQLTIEASECLLPGGAIGFSLPLRVLFPLVEGKPYSAIVLLPGATPKDPGRASAPLQVCISKLEVAGQSRPPYGSTVFWKRLLEVASKPNPDVVLSSIVENFQGGVFLSLRLDKQQPHSLRPNPERETLILIRDRNGLPVSDWQGAIERSLGWELYDADDPSHTVPYAFNSHLTGAPRPLALDDEYTVLAAVNLGGQKRSLIVPKPVAYDRRCFDPRELPDMFGKFPPDNLGKAPHAALATAELSPESLWEERARFAGKPFAGLRLEIRVEQGRNAVLELRNVTSKPISVWKWEGNSDFEMMLHDPRGRPVAKTVKGAKFFGSGALLNCRSIKSNDVIGAAFPLTEYFDMKAPGEYTVLASLPVVGDVDAVLTAEPTKVRVEGAQAPPKK